MSEKKPVTVGGQAVIEGVMMRGPEGYAIAVRRADGTIQKAVHPHVPLGRRVPLFKLPILRGAGGLFEMMAIGMRSLEYSAQQASLDDPHIEKKKLEAEAASIHSGVGPEIVPTSEKPISKVALGATMAFSLALGIAMFVIIPNLATHFTGSLVLSSGEPLLEENAPITYNLISGAIRMLIIVGYIWLISLMPDVKRLFQYHGAEHKAVSAFEAGQELTVGNVRPFTKLHPRCGTTFIAITLIVAIITFAFFARLVVWIWPDFYNFSFWARKSMLIFGHILIMPLVAGVCFELLRLGGKYRKNILLKLLITPGFWFQHLTVREPDDSMIEVAIESLKAALAIPEAAPVYAPQPAYAAAAIPTA
ncbi:MAG: DUF1385 domain-containing protein [Candidatus Sumerlaeaceae bacterium]